MPRRYPPHVCALPGCDVITTNAKYCCHKHACEDAVNQDQTARSAAAAAIHAQRRKADEAPIVTKPASLVMVDARGRWPAITLDQIDLGGLPGTAVQAYPFPA